jgi:hypothetical protein
VIGDDWGSGWRSVTELLAASVHASIAFLFPFKAIELTQIAFDLNPTPHLDEK